VPKLLALDTATEACSVALYCDGDVYHQDLLAPREHTQKILPMVDQMLAETGLTLAQLDGIIFARGPGSFTGVRIGIGIVQGLAFGAGLPVCGVSTLATLAQGAIRVHQADSVLVAIDARMQEVYWGQYGNRGGIACLLDEERVIPPAKLLERPLVAEGCVVAAGTGWGAYADTLAPLSAQALVSDQVVLPSALDMLTLGAEQWRQGGFVDVELAQPVYLRDEVAWKKLPGRD